MPVFLAQNYILDMILQRKKKSICVGQRNPTGSQSNKDYCHSSQLASKLVGMTPLPKILVTFIARQRNQTGSEVKASSLIARFLSYGRFHGSF